MSKIRFAHKEDASYVRFAESLGPNGERPNWAEGLSDAELEDSTRFIFGAPDELEAFEVVHQPNSVTRPHAHEEDEIIYILDGCLLIGARILSAGSAIFVPSYTLYTYKAGPEGVRYLNFRPRAAQRAFITKDEFMAERQSK